MADGKGETTDMNGDEVTKQGALTAHVKRRGDTNIQDETGILLGKGESSAGHGEGSRDTVDNDLGESRSISQVFGNRRTLVEALTDEEEEAVSVMQASVGKDLADMGNENKEEIASLPNTVVVGGSYAEETDEDIVSPPNTGVEVEEHAETDVPTGGGWAEETEDEEEGKTNASASSGNARANGGGYADETEDEDDPRRDTARTRSAKGKGNTTITLDETDEEPKGKPALQPMERVLGANVDFPSPNVATYDEAIIFSFSAAHSALIVAANCFLGLETFAQMLEKYELSEEDRQSVTRLTTGTLRSMMENSFKTFFGQVLKDESLEPVDTFATIDATKIPEIRDYLWRRVGAILPRQSTSADGVRIPAEGSASSMTPEKDSRGNGPSTTKFTSGHRPDSTSQSEAHLSSRHPHSPSFDAHDQGRPVPTSSGSGNNNERQIPPASKRQKIKESPYE